MVWDRFVLIVVEVASVAFRREYLTGAEYSVGIPLVLADQANCGNPGASSGSVPSCLITLAGLGL